MTRFSVVRSALHSVQGGQPFAGPGAAHDDRGVLDRPQVEGVKGLVVLQHNEVGDIDHVADGPQSGAGQPVLQPLGRRPDPHPVDHGGGVPVAQVGVGYGDADPLADGGARLLVGDFRFSDLAAGERRHLVCHAQHREAVQPVRGELQVQHGVAQVLRQRLPQGRVVGQDDDAGVVVAQSQLQFGADHPLGFDAPDARRRQGLVPSAVGVVEERPDPGEADLLSLGHVGRPADHFHFVRAGGDGAEAEPVGVGMRAHGGHAAHEYIAPSADFLHLAHLHASHGEPVGQVGGREVHFDVLPEPA